MWFPLYIILVASIFWTKKFTNWQIIFAFEVIDPQVLSHLNFICTIDNTENPHIISLSIVIDAQ